MHPRILPLLLVPVLLVATRVGHAESVDAKERRARTACLAGDYAEGIRLLSELFVATTDAAFIYNQGRCFEQNRRYEDAIGRFEEFLRVAQGQTKSQKADAKKHIASCQALAAKQGASQSSTTGADSSKEGRERAARKACLAGNADKGSEILSDLYLDYKDPTHIYNLGRCYEQNHRYEDAVSRFREYLMKASKLSEADRAETEKHIANCLAYLGKSDTSQPARRTEPPKHTTAEGSLPANAEAATVADAKAANDSYGASSAESSVQGSRKHARQLGLFFQLGRVLVPGASYGIAAGLEIQAGALIGYYKGTWLGLRYLLFDGAVKPGLGLAMPLFLVNGKGVAGVEGSAVVQWDFTRHVGAYASLGFSYFPGAASDLGSFWFLPAIGAQVRL